MNLFIYAIERGNIIYLNGSIKVLYFHHYGDLKSQKAIAMITVTCRLSSYCLFSLQDTIATICNVGPTGMQHWLNVSCLLGTGRGITSCTWAPWGTLYTPHQWMTIWSPWIWYCFDRHYGYVDDTLAKLWICVCKIWSNRWVVSMHTDRSAFYI